MRAAFTYLFTLAITYASAQESFLFARNNPENTSSNATIELKWFSAEFISDEGFYVYRREVGVGDWTLLTSVPVTKAATIDSRYLREDDELAFFVDVINNSPEDLKEDFMLFNVVLKSFQSNPFAQFLGIYYQDHTAISGRSYQYRVTRLSNGTETEVATSRSIQAGAYVPENPVEEVEVYQQRREVAINWKQDEQRFYAVNIYQVASSQPVRLNDQPIMLSMISDSTGRLVYPKPMFKKRGFEENQAYRFFIEGLDYFGGTTLPSDSVLLVFDDTTPPPAPNGLRGKADSMRVKLNWEASISADLLGYELFRSTKSTGPFEKIHQGQLSIADTSFVEVLSVPGPYYYYLEAVDHASNRSRSDMTFIDVQDVDPPATPLGLTIEADTGRFALRWQPNSEPDLKGYFVFRTVDKTSSSKNYLLMNAEPLDTNYYEQVLPKVVKNEFYYYVVAIDTSFNRSKPSLYANSVLPDVTPPEEPFVKNVSYEDEHIIIEWSQNVEEDLAGYHIYRIDSAAAPVRQKVNINLLSPVTFRYTDRSAASNKSYYYQLVAEDNRGNMSDFSKPVFARIHHLEEINEELVLTMKSKRQKRTNKLEWNTITSTQIKGYVLFRGNTKRTMKPYSEILKSTTVFTDKVEKQANYFYQVRAYTLIGQVIYSPIIEYESN